MPKTKGFKNILGKDGVVMMTVVVIMTLLIMLAASLYLSLVNERTELYESVRSEQLYQTAVSVNDWVFDYLSMYGSTMSSYVPGDPTGDALLDRMLTMIVDPDDFIETGWEQISDGGEFMGDYRISIAREPDPDPNRLLYAITTEIRGRDSTDINKITRLVEYAGFDDGTPPVDPHCSGICGQNLITDGCACPQEGDTLTIRYYSNNAFMSGVTPISFEEYHAPGVAVTPKDPSVFNESHYLYHGVFWCKDRTCMIDADNHPISSPCRLDMVQFTLPTPNTDENGILLLRAVWEPNGEIRTQNEDDGFFNSMYALGTTDNTHHNRTTTNGTFSSMVGMNVTSRIYFGNNRVSFSNANIQNRADFYGDLNISGGGSGGTIFDAGYRPVEVNIGGHYRNEVSNTASLFGSTSTRNYGGIVRVRGNMNISNSTPISGLNIYDGRAYTTKIYCWGNFENQSATMGMIKDGAEIWVWGTINITHVQDNSAYIVYYNPNRYTEAQARAVAGNKSTIIMRPIQGADKTHMDEQLEILKAATAHYGVDGWGDPIGCPDRVNYGGNHCENAGTACFKNGHAGCTHNGSSCAVPGTRSFRAPVWDVANPAYPAKITTAQINATTQGHANENEIKINTGIPVITINESGYIRTALSQPESWNPSPTKAIIIDTTAGGITSDPSTHKDIYIRLCGNSGSNFIWHNYGNNTGIHSTAYLNIIVRGAGNVIFFMDNGITYKGGQGIFIGHEGWLKELNERFTFFNYNPSSPNSPNIPAIINGNTGGGGNTTNSTAIKDYINSLIHLYDDCSDTACKYFCTDDIVNNFGRHLFRQDSGVDMITKHSTGLFANTFIHNNIFLVGDSQSDRTNTTIMEHEFLGLNNVLLGFVYAPDAHYREVITTPANSALVMGGMKWGRVSSGDFKTRVPTIHTMPVDYYGKDAEGNRVTRRGITGELVGSVYWGQTGSTMPIDPPPAAEYADFTLTYLSNVPGVYQRRETYAKDTSPPGTPFATVVLKGWSVFAGQNEGYEQAGWCEYGAITCCRDGFSSDDENDLIAIVNCIPFIPDNPSASPGNLQIFNNTPLTAVWTKREATPGVPGAPGTFITIGYR